MIASDRAPVTEAADRIDAILRHDPYTFSESLSSLTRAMFVSPLAVAFEISEADLLVTVKAVWRIG